MNNPSSISSVDAAVSGDARLRHLPAEARDAFTRHQTEGDLAALDVVVFAIVADFAPRPPEKPIADYPETTKLIEDLGFDSLAITELVFFTEDLFTITIANEEILQVRTIADLRAFVRRKVAARPAAS